MPNLNFTSASEQNTDVKINLDSNSKFDAYEDILVYTHDNSLYVAQNNTTTLLSNAFSGSVLQLKTTSDSIALITKDSANKETLLFYSFSNLGIKRIKLSDFYQKFKFQNLLVLDNTLYIQTDTKIIEVNPNTTSTANEILLFQADPDDVDEHDVRIKFDFTDCVISPVQNSYDKNILFIQNNNLYYIKQLGASITLSNILLNPSYTNSSYPKFSQIEIVDNVGYGFADNGIYSFELKNGTLGKVTKVSDMVVSKDKQAMITKSSNSEIVAYILSNTELNIKKYIKNDNEFVYFNTFDNKDYIDPSVFKETTVARLSVTANVYISPKNLQVINTIKANELFLVLTEQDGYLFISNNHGEKGYIKASKDQIEYINNKSKNPTIGQFIQPLHQNVKLYKYPYDSAQEIVNLTIFDQLTVIDNVAEIEGQQVWNWYHVYYTNGEEIKEGYVKSKAVSPFTSLTPPKIYKSVKVKTSTIGKTVSLYSLPSEDSIVIKDFTDGQELDLAEEYNPKSTWTKVIYNDSYAYVKTANIQKSGLTSLQIAIIVVVCVTITATAIILVILYRRKKY